jgi:hypothetical protein
MYMYTYVFIYIYINIYISLTQPHRQFQHQKMIVFMNLHNYLFCRHHYHHHHRRRRHHHHHTAYRGVDYIMKHVAAGNSVPHLPKTLILSFTPQTPNPNPQTPNPKPQM